MDRNHGLDDIDRTILDLLQREGRITNVRLAKAVGLSQASALERVRKLEERGYIERYVALVNQEMVGRGTVAWALVRLSFHKEVAIDSFVQTLQAHEDVLECYHVTGEDDYLLKVMVPDIGSYREFLLGLLTQDVGVEHVKTMMVLGTIKRETRVPLDAPPPDAPDTRPAAPSGVYGEPAPARLVQLPASSAEITYEELAYVASRDDILEQTYAYLAYKQTDVGTGGWLVRVTGSVTAGASLEPERIASAAAAAAAAGESSFVWGYRLATKPNDPRRVETRVHVAEGEPTHVTLHVVTRNRDRSPKAEVTAFFPWPDDETATTSEDR